jgi:salicylate hydroxylase
MGQRERIVITGAGIGGLTAALALLRAGREVLVLEQSQELGEVGAGLTVTPNASRALASLGLGEALQRIGSAPPAGAILHYATGETLVPLPQDESAARHGAPLYHIHRADLHATLAAAVEALGPGCVRLGARLASVEQGDGEVSLTLTSGERLRGAALVGSDGLRSRVRESMFSGEAPAFAGFVAYRGLVPGDALAPELKRQPLAMWLGPGRLFMRYRLRGGALYNFVAVARRGEWVEDGWSVPAKVGEVLGEFADFDPVVLRTVALTPGGTLYRWGLFAHRPLDTWVAARVALLGDAAHAMPPFLGQGAAMAIEDGVVLGRALAIVEAIPEALQRYQSARVGRANAVLQASWATAPLYFGDDPRSQMAALAQGMASQRQLYAYDAATALG